MFLTLLFCVFFPAHYAFAQDVNEEQIKAVFLYNLTHFVTWPEGSAESASGFEIGVFGDRRFRSTLSKTVETETKDGRHFVVEEITNISDITDRCRIIFVSGATGERWDEILVKVDGLPILTVSDQKDFTRSGGMVSLIRQNKKIQIEVNYKAVQEAGLSMSAKLLRLARVVE
ncbi:YfiR family protein [Desulforhopalus sp. 52FAK]